MRIQKKLKQHRYDDLIQDMIKLFRHHKMDMGLPIKINIEHSPEINGVSFSFYAYHFEETIPND